MHHSCMAAPKVVPSHYGTATISATDTGTVLMLPDGRDLCMPCPSGSGGPAYSDLREPGR